MQCVNRHPAFLEGQFIDQRLTLDGVQLTPAGYGVWRRAVEPYIYRLSAAISNAKPDSANLERRHLPTEPVTPFGR